MEHCDNFDASFDGCKDCPGMVRVIRRDGTVETLCRAGEKYIRELIASSERPTATNAVPVYPIRFPSPLPDRPA